MSIGPGIGLSEGEKDVLLAQQQAMIEQLVARAARQSGSESPSIKIGKSSRARADGRAEPERRHEPWMIVTLAAF